MGEKVETGKSKVFTNRMKQNAEIFCTNLFKLFFCKRSQYRQLVSIGLHVSFHLGFRNNSRNLRLDKPVCPIRTKLLTQVSQCCHHISWQTETFWYCEIHFEPFVHRSTLDGRFHLHLRPGVQKTTPESPESDKIMFVRQNFYISFLLPSHKLREWDILALGNPLDAVKKANEKG